MSTAAYSPKAEDVKKLRDATSAPMMDCRRALIDADGDFQKSKTLLQERGAAQAQKKAERSANEGVVASYIHAGSKIGVLIELNSETDFVARNPKFGELARDVAMHIAAMSPKYVDRASVPESVVAEARDEIAKNVPPGKPADVQSKIVEGKLNKWYEEHCLLDQPFVKDDSMSVADLINGVVGVLGEKIIVRRYTKYALGDQ
ncbi:MAG: translation elongation factor Ts [Candidatus Eremiobacteraeota bacterium]|nr:translation elongation factor Ts [Candidatus Eremiobacteraeota bacterium]